MEETQASTPFTCMFWDETKSALSSQGCTFVSVSFAEVLCYCEHATDFMSFLKTGKEVLVSANHSVFSVLWEMKGSDLLDNMGVYFVFSYWIIYISLAVLFSQIDRCKLRRNYYRKLFIQMHGHDPLYQHSSDRKLPTHSETDRARRTTLVRTSIIKVTPLRPPTETLGFSSIKTLTLTDIHADAEAKSAWTKISKKLKLYASAAKESRKCCCCVMGRVVCSELQTNNLPFNLFSTTSPMSPRVVRLTLFCFACLL